MCNEMKPPEVLSDHNYTTRLARSLAFTYYLYNQSWWVTNWKQLRYIVIIANIHNGPLEYDRCKLFSDNSASIPLYGDASHWDDAGKFFCEQVSSFLP